MLCERCTAFNELFNELFKARGSSALIDHFLIDCDVGFAHHTSVRVGESLLDLPTHLEQTNKGVVAT